MTRISPDEFEMLARHECPDCAGFIFRPGPRGGAAQNIECVGCGSRYNMVHCMTSLEQLRDRIPQSLIYAERIGHNGEWREDMFPKVLQ